MKKLLLLFILFLLQLSYNYAQSVDSSSIKIVNQYQVEVADAFIETAEGNQYKADKRGFVCLPSSDEQAILTIKANQHETVVTTYATIHKMGTITLQKHFSWKDLMTPMFYIINGGLWLILFIIFAETGLFAGFFLPGDSLLFVAGIYNKELIGTIFPFISSDILQLMLLWALISTAGILGNMAGYWFGKKVGPSMYHWKDNIIFKKHYLEEAHDFYEKHGGGAIIFARFIPIVRTFAPIIAGIVNMDKRKFTFFNVLGSLVWVVSMLVAGHFLQKWILAQFDFDLKKHLEVIVIGIVVITTAPVFIKLLTSKYRNKNTVNR